MAGKPLPKTWRYDYAGIVMDWSDDGLLAALTRLFEYGDEELGKQAVKVAARAYKKEIKTYIKQSKLKEISGLERSISDEQIIDGTCIIYTRHRAARFIEEGTGRYGPLGRDYEITSKKVARLKPNSQRVLQSKKRAARLKRKSSTYSAARLKIPMGGEFRFPFEVIHPGMPPRPFFFRDFPYREAIMAQATEGYLARKLRARR